MKVSVIINCHNGAKFLKHALDSALSQTYENIEVIFFDNYSSDGTGDLVSQYKDERVKYFRSDTFLSLGQARNEALQRAGGQLIAFLDSDDIWMPTKLELQVPLFTEGVGLVYTTAEMVHLGKTTKVVSNKKIQGNLFGTLLGDYFLVMSSVVISREALYSLNQWFDPRFEIIEEYDLFLRIAANWQLKSPLGRLTQWRWHAGSTTFTKTKLITKEKRILLRKLKEEFPTLYRENVDAVTKVRGKIIVTLALVLLRRNQSKKARALLRRSSIITKKGLFVYFASFFPYASVDKLYRFLKGNPLI
tara:strand:- start:1378 stop:2289 length:912 start_codon:yes stop_codon:yes gene_type:complete